MLQFPKLGVVDCDENLDGPESTIRQGIKDKITGKQLVAPIMPDLSYTYGSVNYFDDARTVPMESRYKRAMDLLNEFKSMPDIQTICLDSLTMMDHYIIKKVLDDQKRTELKPLDYATIKNLYWGLLVTGLRASGKDHIVSCHEIPITEPSPGNMMKEVITGYEPSVTSKIRHFLGAFFKDIWRMVIETEATAQGNVSVVKLYTCKTPKSPELKNSLGLPAVMTASYAEIAKYIK
jgi:hypothetical protein